MTGDRARRIRPDADHRLSRSTECGLAMLECFSAERTTLGVSDLADMLSLSRSTTHRYAISLVALGYLEQDDKRRYRLTHRAAAPGMAAIGALRMETPAQAILEELRDRTRATVSLGVLDETRVIYVHRFFGHRAGQYEADMELGIGAYVLLHCTAIGKALLASLGLSEQAEILGRLTLSRHGPNTLTTTGDLTTELARFRLDGIAVCDEEQAVGVRSIAKTILRPSGSRPMAISVTAPARGYTVGKLREDFGAHLTTAAARMKRARQSRRSNGSARGGFRRYVSS
jgi:DNA-binding IclR family transcriptional regulator